MRTFEPFPVGQTYALPHSESFHQSSPDTAPLQVYFTSDKKTYIPYMHDWLSLTGYT